MTVPEPNNDGGDADADGDGGGGENIQAIQAECTAMISLLRDLEKEEHDLHCQLEILAREALLCGFQNDVIEPPIPKKRKTKAQMAQMAQEQQQQKQAQAKQQNQTTDTTTTTKTA